MRYSVEKKWIEHNKKEFGVQIIELKNIISEQVKNGGKSDEFTSDMLVALVTGRKITPKMKDAIDNIINKIILMNSIKEMNGYRAYYLNC